MPYGDLTGSRATTGWGNTRSRSRSYRGAIHRNAKSFLAKYPGECAYCEHPISVGQAIRRAPSDATEHYQHVSCYRAGQG